MTAFPESVVEDAALDWLKATGWQVAHGPDIAPNCPRPSAGITAKWCWTRGCATRWRGSALLSQVHRLPHSLTNVPNRAYWLAPERADASRQYIARHGNVFMALLVAFMCFVHWQVVDANRTQPARLAEEAFIAGLVRFLVATVVWAGVCMRVSECGVPDHGSRYVPAPAAFRPAAIVAGRHEA